MGVGAFVIGLSQISSFFSSGVVSVMDVSYLCGNMCPFVKKKSKE